MTDLDRAKRAVAEEGLGAWLFCNQFHKDPIADRVLGIPPERHNTRPWLYLLPAHGEGVKIVHAIEAGLLDHLPGERRVYASRERFLAALRELAGGMSAAGGATTVGCQFSEELPALSYLDHGMARLLEQCGFGLRSSAALVQRLLGVLEPEGIASHERAAGKLYEVVARVWDRLAGVLGEGHPVREGEVQGWMLSLFDEKGLVSDSPPIVAAGVHSGDPHYEPKEGGAVLQPGEVLQLDLWAREPDPAAVYADISWVGVLGPTAPEEVRLAFAAVREARELAVRFIGGRLAAGRPPAGREVDEAVRSFLTRAGHGEHLRHRTGHAIDQRVHGFGANLDSVEFPDTRRLLEGACFSVEPGVYLANFGVRTEVDVYIRDGRPVVSGGPPQGELLSLHGTSA